MKRNKVFIMNGDIPVAELRDDNCFHRINKEVEAPIALFYGRDTVDLVTFQNWYRERVFPRERAGVEDLLKLYNSETYNVGRILEKTHGRMIQDSYYVEVGDK